MTYQQAIIILEARQGVRHARLRWLCSDANPERDSREGYRAHVLREASREPGEPPPEPDPRPPIAFAPAPCAGCGGG